MRVWDPGCLAGVIFSWGETSPRQDLRQAVGFALHGGDPARDPIQRLSHRRVLDMAVGF